MVAVKRLSEFSNNISVCQPQTLEVLLILTILCLPYAKLQWFNLCFMRHGLTFVWLVKAAGPVTR